MDWTSEASAKLTGGDMDGFADLMDANYDAFSPPTAENAGALSALLEQLVEGLESGSYADQEDQPLYYTWMLLQRFLKAGFGVPASLDMDRLSTLAEMNHTLGGDGDSATLGWYHVLLVDPHSDAVLDKMLTVGANSGGYFHQDAFLTPAGRTADADRKGLLVALHLLVGYTQGVAYHNADKAMADLLQYHSNYRSDAPSLSVRHFREADARLKALSLPWNHLREADWTALQAEFKA